MFDIFRKRMSEYDKLRESVGMDPARDDEYYEAVAWVVVFDLLAAEVANECKTLPTEQRQVFMIAYAAYLRFLAMKVVESKFPPDSWRLIAPLLEREFSKQQWYQPEIMSRIFDSMINHPPTAKASGRHFNASLGPWPGAVVATNHAGYKLNSSANLEFVLYVAITSGKILETITKMALKCMKAHET